MAKKEGIRKLFDTIAPEYDSLNHILSLNTDKGWRRKAMKEIIDCNYAMDILDIACGTADFTIEIARKAPEGSRISGLDLSEGMLQVGRKKVEAAGIKANLVQGDCENLPYQDNTFDRITVGFGVRNFENLELCLREMRRILRPEGKLVILELSMPSNPVICWFYKLYFLHILPVIGGWISGDKAAYRYLPASVVKFPKPEKFVEIIKKSGFEKACHRSFTFGICRMYVCEGN